MNRFRYWLADLISGGELTQVNEQLERMDADLDRILANQSLTLNVFEKNARQKATIAEMANKLNLANYDAANGWANSERFSETLRQIAAEVKPTSNATVKRMGRIAEDALK